MLDCAKSLAQNPEHSTDGLVLPLIELQQIGMDFHDVLRIGCGREHDITTIDLSFEPLRLFRQRVEEFKSSLPRSLSQNGKNIELVKDFLKALLTDLTVVVDLAIHFAGIHVHEMDLLNPFRPPNNPGNVNLVVENHQPGPSKCEVLLTCLGASQQYLQRFLGLPCDSYSRISCAQWSALAYSTVIIYRLSLGVPHIPEWNTQAARNCRLEDSLASLCDKMQHITRNRRPPSESKLQQLDLYSVTGLVFENVKSSYERLKGLPQEMSISDDQPVHATFFPKPVTEDYRPPQPSRVSVPPSRCPAFQWWGWATPQMTPQCQYGS
jgi:hypothetical protein